MLAITNVRKLSVTELDAAFTDIEKQLMRAQTRDTVAELENARRRLLNEFRRRGL